MSALYQLAGLTHLLAVIVWVGGTLFLVMVMVPLARGGMLPPRQRAALLGAVARRYRPIAWTAIAVLVASGVFMAWEHWRVSPLDLFTGGGWFVSALRVKAGLVAVVIFMITIHDFVLGPRLTRQLEAQEGRGPSPSVRRSRRRLLTLAGANLAGVLGILAIAVMMTRGSPF